MRTRLLLSVALVPGIAVVPGCTMFRALAFHNQMDEARENARIGGRIEVEGEAQGNLVVVIGRLVSDTSNGEQPANPDAGPSATPRPGEQLVGVDSYVRVRPGTYRFVVGPGRYQIGAWEDKDQNGKFDPGERALRPRDAAVIEVAAGGDATHDIRIPIGATLPDITTQVDVLDLVARTPDEQRQFALGALSVAGEVCADLSDEKFGPESGTRGLWEPMDFINDGLAGIYLMEEYDPGRVPVLFVHGINGYPQHFTTLIDSIDKERFQAWFYFYPSAAPLRRVAEHLASQLVRLQARFDLDDLAIVAHSMGGLVSRGAILEYQDLSGRDDIKLHLTISSPFGGADSAAFAASAPIELPPVFQDMAPTSDYLRWLFWQDEERTVSKQLPDGVEFHMIIGYHMPGSDDVAYDGVVTVLSQARVEAQEQAKSIRVLDYEHVAILSSKEAIDRMRLLLDQRF